MQQTKCTNAACRLREEFLQLNRHQLNRPGNELPCHRNLSKTYLILLPIIVLFLCVLYQTNVLYEGYVKSLGVRCIIPNNYFIWEATRPISNCDYCSDVSAPIVLNNATRDEFAPFAYTSKPIVIKKASLHWPAMHKFNFDFFKELYKSIDDSYRSVDEECQFLHFRSNFISIKDVFDMKVERVLNKPGQKSWYVGW